MLFRTQIIFCSSELRLHFRIAEVGSLLSLNRAWRAQVTYGIRNHTLNWISSFLTNRTHHVVVNGSTVGEERLIRAP